MILSGIRKFFETKKLKKEREEERQEWHDRIAKEGVNPTWRPKATTTTGLTCPRCRSDQIVTARYGDRFLCKKCGKVFM